MKAIILAAGKWTRLLPITLNKPKSMIKINKKPILEYIIEDVYEKVTELIIIVKYKKEAVISHFWDNYKWTKITYIEQWDKKWTAAALMGIKSDEDVLITYSDTIISKSDMDKIIDFDGNAILANEVENPEKYWIFRVDDKNNMIEIVEKPKKYIWNLANFAFYKLDKDILRYVNEVKISERWEYELTDAINMLAKNKEIQILSIDNDFHDITFPEDIETANKYYLNK